MNVFVKWRRPAMNKKYCKKCLIAILSIILFLGNVLTIGIQTSAVEIKEFTLPVNEKADEKISDNPEDKKIDFKNEDVTGNDIIVSETEGADDIEKEEANADKILAIDESEPKATSDDIASGFYGNITWVIDADGKLTVEGRGDFSQSNRYNRAPWYDNRDAIKSAQIIITDMENAAYMFSGCSKLTSIDVSRFDTSSVTDMSNMFLSCSSLINLNVSNFDTSNVNNMDSMFYGCSSLTNLDVSDFDTSNVTVMTSVFTKCSKLASIDVSGFDTSSVRDMSGMFYGCSSLNNLDVSNFDTGNVTDISFMFQDCSGLTNLDVSNFNTSNVKRMEQVFSGCSSLIDLNVSSFDTANVANMSGMFAGCSSLRELDLDNFDTSNVTNMWTVFAGCSSLTDLNVSSFDTSNVTTMFQMFAGCSSLVNLDISNFDTRNITDMREMFLKCSSIAMLDMRGFNLNNLAEAFDFLRGCTALETIYTPYNLTQSVSLPIANVGDVWCLSDGPEVTALPQNLNYSVVIVKKKIPSEEEIKKFVITFDANGGSVGTKIMETNASGKITEFPKAELSGTIFGGWYTEPVFGDRVSTDKIFNENTTLYARYFTENEVRYKDDMACFPNQVSYKLTDTDRERYYSNLDFSTLYRIRNTYEKKMKNKTDGVCFGISSLIVQNKTGKFNPNIYNANCFNELDPSNNIDFASILTIYQLSQEENAIKNEQKRFAKLSLSEKLKEIIERGEEVSTKGPSIFCFRFGSFPVYGEHAIVIDGIEYGDVEVGGNTYYYTIKTYDINTNEGRPEYVLWPNGTPVKVYKSSPSFSYIYISKNLDAWTMKNGEYFNGEKQSGLKGKNELLAAYNSNKIFVSYSNWEQVGLDSMLFINETIGSKYTLNIRGEETVITNGIIEGDIDTGVYTVGEIDSEENSLLSTTVFLPDNYEETVLKKEGNNNISIMHASGYDLLSVESAKANELRFGQSVGEMQILGNDGEYHFDLVNENMSVDELNIHGLTKGDVSIQCREEGLLLSSTGENLVSISLNGSEQTLYENVREENIFIKDAEGTVKLFIDKNNDDVYETEWTKGSNTEDDQTENSGSGEGNSTGGNENNSSGNSTNGTKENNKEMRSGKRTWEPTTPDEKKRYACVGKEAVQYTLEKDNAYHIIIENSIQGPLCFDSFEAVLEDFTIGRTYNIYPYPDKIYSMDEEVEFTIKIPEEIYEPDRKYRMICVTKGGLPIVYEDLDNNPETITVRTNKFYAYALIYKDEKEFAKANIFTLKTKNR